MGRGWVEDHLLDAFAFVDSDGAVVAPGLESGTFESFPGWFPCARVKPFAEAVRLEFTDDEVTGWKDLARRYPGFAVRDGESEGLTVASVWVAAALSVPAAPTGLGVVAAGVASRQWGLMAAALPLLGIGGMLGAQAVHLHRSLTGPRPSRP